MPHEVHEHVQRCEPVAYESDHFVPLPGGGDIEAGRDDLRAVCLDPIGQSPQGAFDDIGDHDSSTFAGEELGGRCAEAAGRAGDQCDLAAESLSCHEDGP